MRYRISAAALALAVSFANAAQAADVRFVVTQAQAGDARRYQPLVRYLETKGIAASFVTARDFVQAARCSLAATWTRCSAAPASPAR